MSDNIAGRSKEEICREILEEYYGFPFPNMKPFWLINPLTGRHLEIDCYCEQLGIGVEYDGRYHKDLKQAARDRIKDKLCKKSGFTLIRINRRTRGKDIKKRLLRRLPSKEELLANSFKPPTIPFTEEDLEDY